MRVRPTDRGVMIKEHTTREGGQVLILYFARLVHRGGGTSRRAHTFFTNLFNAVFIFPHP